MLRMSPTTTLAAVKVLGLGSTSVAALQKYADDVAAGQAEGDFVEQGPGAVRLGDAFGVDEMRQRISGRAGPG